MHQDFQFLHIKTTTSGLYRAFLISREDALNLYTEEVRAMNEESDLYFDAPPIERLPSEEYAKKVFGELEGGEYWGLTSSRSDHERLIVVPIVMKYIVHWAEYEKMLSVSLWLNSHDYSHDNIIDHAKAFLAENLGDPSNVDIVQLVDTVKPQVWKVDNEKLSTMYDKIENWGGIAWHGGY